MLAAFGCRFAEERFQTGARCGVGQNAFPRLVTLTSQEEAGEIGHLVAFGVREGFTNTDDFLSFSAHVVFIHERRGWLNSVSFNSIQHFRTGFTPTGA